MSATGTLRAAIGAGLTGAMAVADVGDEAARVRLASHGTTEPEVLDVLARDPSITVRAAVAMNSAAPASVNCLLSADKDERVRALLAGRVAALLPGLSRPEQEHVRDHVLAILFAMVEDEAERVRAAIAGVLAAVPEAPRELILRLARDAAVSVLDPVIRLSPLLTTTDLLALIACPATEATVQAVARRANLPEAVSDAVAETANSTAIRLLLGNSSASIREATLDALSARASAHEEWHISLVHRPRLSEQATYALSTIVRTELLSVLARRRDLSPKLRAELDRRLAERLATEPRAKPASAASHIADAEALAARGALDERALLDAVRQGDLGLVAARLAVAARVPLEVVERAIELKSAKGLVSLLWKAGFSMRTAGPVQALLTGTAPEGILSAGPAGSFPLAIGEMRWQVDFLSHRQE
ncbi:MAG: DUF2336 domain-containing protein [Rhodospirillales bacterium]|nr:DUF2336 domain-containing protein [Rhodospirillales bacterium]